MKKKNVSRRKRWGGAQIPSSLCWKSAPWAGAGQATFEPPQQWRQEQYTITDTFLEKSFAQRAGLGKPDPHACSASLKSAPPLWSVRLLTTKAQVIFRPSAPEKSPPEAWRLQPLGPPLPGCGLLARTWQEPSFLANCSWPVDLGQPGGEPSCVGLSAGRPAARGGGQPPAGACGLRGSYMGT